MKELPAVFMTYQQELMASSALNGVTVVEKSRRTGYSWAAAAIAVMTAAGAKSAGGMSVYYMGYDHEMAREFINYCANWAKQLAPAASAVEESFWTDPENPDKQIKTFRIGFASGFEIVALPSVARALRGKQGFVIIDEAAFHDDLDGVLKSALALRMWGGRVLIISTHNGDTNPFNTLVKEIRAGKKPYTLLRCTLEDALSQGLYKRMCLKDGTEWSQEKEDAWKAERYAEYGDVAAEELDVIPREGGGKAVPRALIEKRMVLDGPVLRWKCDADFVHLPDHIRSAVARDWCREYLLPELKKLNPDLAHAFGVDFGRSVDLTSMAPMSIGKNLVRRVPFMIELRNVPFDQQREILFFMADALPWLRSGKLDAGGNGSYLAEKAMQRYGESRIECVKFSEPWYRDNMPKLKAAFEDGTLELMKDADVADDISMLELIRGVIRVPERTLGKDGDGRHGDAAISLALAIAASFAEPEEYDYQPGRKAPSGFFGGGEPEARFSMQPPTDEDDNRYGSSRGAGILPQMRAL